MRVAVDVMGGDHGCEVVVAGVKLALAADPNIDGAFLVGRKDDLLKVGGHRLNPQEIEDTLMESGFFVEVVVLGLPDTMLGNKLVILAVPTNETCTENNIFTYCASRLPKFKVPAEVKFVRSLPKKSSGKIDRKACVSMFIETV